MWEILRYDTTLHNKAQTNTATIIPVLMVHFKFKQSGLQAFATDGGTPPEVPEEELRLYEGIFCEAAIVAALFPLLYYHCYSLLFIAIY